MALVSQHSPPARHLATTDLLIFQTHTRDGWSASEAGLRELTPDPRTESELGRPGSSSQHTRASDHTLSDQHNNTLDNITTVRSEAVSSVECTVRDTDREE